MDKAVLQTIVDENKKLAISKVIDVVNICEKTKQKKFSKFLDPAVSYFIEQRMHFDRDVGVRLWGGADVCERRVFCAFPSWEEVCSSDFPICVIKVTSRDISGLSHRDYLGALMGLGIEREMIGDIFISDDAAYIFALNDICDYIMLNLDKIGRVGVKLEVVDMSEAKDTVNRFELLKIGVISCRLDAIIAAVYNLSRNDSLNIIRSGRVSVNYESCESADHSLKQTDLVSVRGFGRFIMGEETGRSKKGRTYFEIKKFI